MTVLPVTVNVADAPIDNGVPVPVIVTVSDVISSVWLASIVIVATVALELVLKVELPLLAEIWIFPKSLFTAFPVSV